MFLMFLVSLLVILVLMLWVILASLIMVWVVLVLALVLSFASLSSAVEQPALECKLPGQKQSLVTLLLAL